MQIRFWADELYRSIWDRSPTPGLQRYEKQDFEIILKVLPQLFNRKYS
jgi:hypothetical protein